MRLTCFRWIAVAVSCLPVVLAVGLLRPHYGGTLRVETSAAMGEMRKTPFAGQIYETLVRSDRRGEIRPWLATTWTHDAAARKWMFTPRKNVVLADGLVWNPGEDILNAPDTKPREEILAEAALPESAVAESGPFRVGEQNAHETVRLFANEGYWGGRPFLDSVEIQMGRTRRDQLLDFEVGKADVVEAEITDIRTLKQRDVVVQVSKPLETVALVFENAKIPSAIRQAVALSVDRLAMQRVMLDRQGEVTGALLPQWISGYAFLFPAARDLVRAKTLAGAGTTLSLCEDAQDRLLHSLADRIAVDVSQAGIAVRSAGNACDVRLVRLSIGSANAQEALLRLASQLDVTAPAWASAYAMECELLRGTRVVPLFQLPVVYALRPKVRNWSAQWDLANVSLEDPE